MNISADNIPVKDGRIITREVDDGTVLVSPTAGKVRVLNRVGAVIWTLIDGQQTVLDIESQLIEKYSSAPSNQIRADLYSFVQDLLNRGLLTIK